MEQPTSIVYSLVSPLFIESQLMPAYETLKEVKVIVLHQGFHDTYLVTTATSKYTFRIYKAGWKTKEQITAELDFLLQLQQKSLSVSFPIPDKSNQFIQTLSCPEGERFGVLFSYAAGKQVPKLTAPVASQFGKHLATLHQISQNLNLTGFARTYTVDAIVAGTLTHLKAALPVTSEAIQMAQKTAKQLEKKLNAATLSQLKMGICHGDPHFENFFTDKNGKITSFDYDFCGPGLLLYDLGSFCRYERNNQPAIAAFLEGYKQIIPLTDHEKALIPYFEILMRFFHLGARATHADGIKNPKWFPESIEDTVDEIGQQIKILDEK